jgi:hypothetical protein
MITAPVTEHDTISRFVDLLREYYDVGITEMSDVVGFDSGVLANWRGGKSLPHRDNFLKFRGWIEEKFDHGTAMKVTHLFIKDALDPERNYKMNQLRNLPPEFWEWKVDITNSPDCKFSIDQPSWAPLVKPIADRQDYFSSIRRADAKFRDEFMEATGVTLSQLTAFEQGGPDDAIVKACKTMDEARVEHGQAPLFDEATYQRLPNAGKRADKPPRSPRLEKKATPQQQQQYEQLKNMFDDTEDREMFHIPETLGEFKALPRDAVDKIIALAKACCRIEGEDADPKNVRGWAGKLVRLHTLLQQDKAASVA